MNKYRKKWLFAMRPCSIALLTLLVAASARAQMPATAPAGDGRSDATTPSSPASPFRLLFAPSGCNPRLASSIRPSLDKGVSREFEKAWLISGDGTTSHESVVLIFRTGTRYIGKLQRFTNEHQRSSFKWNPAALAIVHTHPNASDPKPGEQDRLVADKYGVPNFTITVHGMYVYDPATKKTSKVMDGIDWLDLTSLSQKMAQIMESSPRQAPQSDCQQNSPVFSASNINRPARLIQADTKDKEANHETIH